VYRVGNVQEEPGHAGRNKKQRDGEAGWQKNYEPGINGKPKRTRKGGGHHGRPNKRTREKKKRVDTSATGTL